MQSQVPVKLQEHEPSIFMSQGDGASQDTSYRLIMGYGLTTCLFRHISVAEQKQAIQFCMFIGKS